MREYAKVSPQIWTGRTARAIRGDRDLQVVVQYLIHSPLANMYGLYHLPLPMMCHHLGNMTYERAAGLMEILAGLDYAHYDEESEQVFVVNAAFWQIGESLKPADNRVLGIKSDLKLLRQSPFFDAFLERYREAYHLHDVSPSEAPQKGLGEPLRSQKKEKEKEQEKKKAPSEPLERGSQGAFAIGINGWPPEWAPVQRVILANPVLFEFRDWIADLAFWQAQDVYLESPVNLAKLLEGAAAQLVKEEYRPKRKKDFRQKIGNVLRMEAKIQREQVPSR